jgi:hypothetical protein
MAEDLAALIAGGEFSTRPGASLAAIRDREVELGVTFPADYVDLMLLSNGLDGFLSSEPDSAYIRIDPIEEMANDEEQKVAAEFWPELVVFGSDGGGEAFAFDADHDMRIVMFPWIGGEQHAIVQAATLRGFLRQGPRFAT